MEFIAPILTLLISGSIIFYLLRKRWPELSLLDVDRIPHVIEGRKKDEYIKKKIDERAKESREFVWKKVGVPFTTRFGAWQKRFRQYVGSVEREIFQIKETPAAHTGKELKTVEPVETDGESIEILFKEATAARSMEDWDIAERKYIAVLAIDEKNVEAYRGLADVYVEEHQYKEARETYSYLLHFTPDDDALYVRLGELAEKEGETLKAIEYYEQAVLINPQLPTRFMALANLYKAEGQNEAALEAIRQAVDIEPENPRYLDNYAELAILVGDKKLAKEVVQRLRMVNPDNKKLEAFKDKISQMPT